MNMYNDGKKEHGLFDYFAYNAIVSFQLIYYKMTKRLKVKCKKYC